MFKQNKYTKWYFKICSKTYEGIVEEHHIVPKSLGGTNDSINLVKLSPKAHFICHWLLTKMVTSKSHQKKMIYAFNFMLCKPKDLIDTRYYPCARVYDISKKLMQENNPSFDIDVRKKISDARKLAWKNPSQKMIDGIEKMRKSKIGKPSPYKGIKGRFTQTEEWKQETSKRGKGRKWFNDGKQTYFIRPENALSNYVSGRLKMPRSKKD
jgi:hypothetical protein